MFELLRDALTSSSSGPEYSRGDIGSIMAADLAQRMSDFTVRDAVKMPSVRRAVDIISSVGASFDPLAYEGVQRIDTPRIAARPDPFRSRADWVKLNIVSLIETGEAFWRIGDGYVIVLDPERIEITDEQALQPTYWLDGEQIAPDTLRHIRIGQRPGKAHGTSPLAEALEYLAILHAQELYAGRFFQSNGTPHTVLTTEQALDGTQAAALRDAYIAARATTGVAVLSRGFGAEFPATDPERAQLNEARDISNTVIARLLGIPGPLLLTSGTGGTLVYQNVSQLVTSLARQTILPLYLEPIEAALTDLLPRGQTVRFSVEELQRVDIGDKVAVYAQLLTLGLVTREQVVADLGLDPASMPATPEVLASV